MTVLLKRTAKVTAQRQAFLVNELVINASVIARNANVSKYKFWLYSTNNFGRVEAKGKNVRTRMIVKQFRYLS